MTDTDIFKMSALKLVSLVKSKTLHPFEIAQAHISRINKLGKKIKAFKYFNSELFLKYAKKVNQQMESSKAQGLIPGVPLGIKDVYNTQ